VQLMDMVKNYEFLGREFLLWIWFKSETSGGRYSLEKDIGVELWVDRKIVLQKDDDEGSEKVTCTGDNPHLREARFALRENKQVTESRLRLIIEENEYSFALDSAWMNLKSFKSPKVRQDTKDDPEGVFYEKVYFIDQALSTLDKVYHQFIDIRLSPEWKESELPVILKWIGQVEPK
jgi:hypothetical protein